MSVDVAESMSSVCDDLDLYGSDREAFGIFVDNVYHGYHPELDWAMVYGEFQDAYIGWYSDAESFCGSYLDLGPIDDVVYNHIDWDSVWECELRHDYWREGDCYFRNI